MDVGRVSGRCSGSSGDGARGCMLGGEAAYAGTGPDGAFIAVCWFGGANGARVGTALFEPLVPGRTYVGSGISITACLYVVCGANVEEGSQLYVPQLLPSGTDTEGGLSHIDLSSRSAFFFMFLFRQ